MLWHFTMLFTLYTNKQKYTLLEKTSKVLGNDQIGIEGVISYSFFLKQNRNKFHYEEKKGNPNTRSHCTRLSSLGGVGNTSPPHVKWSDELIYD